MTQMLQLAVPHASVTVPAERVDAEEQLLTSVDTPWNLVIWNDPINLMVYVSYVFQTYFGYSETKANKLMMQVHREGRAVVADGGREQMEQHLVAMHQFGLWATIEQAGGGSNRG